MSGEHILIVDDSKEIINFLSAILVPLGYQLTTVENGRDGLAKILYEKPDLVLLDLNLPGMSGISILEALKQRQVETPIIMMTFHGSDVVIERALRLGAREYIVKPFEIDVMLGAIERVLNEAGSSRPPTAPSPPPVTEIAVAESPPPAQNQSKSIIATLEETMLPLAAAPSQEAFLSHLSEIALQLSHAEASAVFLPGGTTRHLTIIAVRLRKNFRHNLQIHDVHAEAVFNTGTPKQVPGSTTPPGFAAHFGKPIQTTRYVPIQLPKRVLGVLSVAYLQNAPSIDDWTEAQHWLQVLANYAAIVLENAHLHESLRKTVPLQRTTDVLNMLVQYTTGPVQRLWQTVTTAQNGGATPDPENLSKEVKRFAVLLSIIKEIATSKGPFSIASAPTASVEEELKRRLSAVED